MDHYTPQEVAGKVAAAVLASPLSKRAVAEAAGIPATTFQRKLKGATEFHFSELLRLAEVLGVHPSKLAPSAFLPSMAVAA